MLFQQYFIYLFVAIVQTKANLQIVSEEMDYLFKSTAHEDGGRDVIEPNLRERIGLFLFVCFVSCLVVVVAVEIGQ